MKFRPNPKHSLGYIGAGIRNFFAPPSPSLSGHAAKRKPSPRKLEPHEVIAKLKARRVVHP